MTWLTWRQFRAPAWAALAAVALVAGALAITGPHLAHLYRTSGVATCAATNRCAAAQAAFFADLTAGGGYPVLYFAGVALLYLTPVLIGMFWGAPLIARELEAGTLRVAWTQSVTRTRWLATKLTLVGVAAMLLTGLLSLAVSWWSVPIDRADALPGERAYSGLPNRFNPLIFGARGITPIGYAALAFAVGVTVGLLVRHTLAAMAMTVVVLVAIQTVVPMYLRAHYRPPVHTTVAIRLSPDADFQLRIDDDTMRVTVPVDIPGAWITSVRMTDAAGRAGVAPTPQACRDPAATPQACDDAINRLQLVELVSYQPADRYWPFQCYETVGYLVMALILATMCLSRVRRLRPM